MKISKLSFKANEQDFKKIGDNLVVDKNMVAAVYQNPYYPCQGTQIVLKNANGTALTPTSAGQLMNAETVAKQLNVVS